MKRLFILCFAFCGIIFSLSCKKQSIQGPQGDPGPNGSGGNATINSSAIFSIDSLEWHLNTTNNVWEAVVSQTLISQTVMDKGAVKMYMQLNNAWWELPYSIADQVTQFSFKLGQVNLITHDVEGATPSRPSAKNYRLVVLLDSN